MKKFLLGSLLLCGLSATGQEQLPADSLLPEALVTAYGIRPGQGVAAAVSVLDRTAFMSNGEASPLYALNELPGVRLEERAPGSYRLNIRGSSLRSPFGVRNVKVYWNNLPLTEANGTTPLNLLDVALYRQVEVVRGPAASYYGAGTGGVLNISSLERSGLQSGPEAELAAGSWGYRRLKAGYQQAGSQQQWRLGATQLHSQGYREHSDLLRQNVFWTGRHQLSPRQQLETNLLLARADYSIPGGLTAEQFAEDPRMSRPLSIERNASVHHRYALAGIGHEWTIRPGLGNRTYLFGSSGFYDHPFITDYKRDFSAGGGLRTLFEHTRQLGEHALQLQAGGEYQQGLDLARNFGNRAGQPDTLNFDDEIRSRTALAFAQADLYLRQQLSLSAGLSLNWFANDIFRLWDSAQQRSYRLQKSFDPVWAPRIGALWDISRAWQLYGQISRGFSPPSLDEIRTNEGSLNQDLEAERGTNYELGVRTSLLKGTISGSLTAYYLHLQQTITSFVTEGSTVAQFRNAGETRQRGLETQWQLQLLRTPRWQLESALSATWQHFRFARYRQQENDYSGNALPGIAPLSSSASLHLRYRQGLRLSLMHQATGSMPLNDANTAYTDPYQLLNARLDLRLARWQSSGLRLFFSGQNLLNERYSLGFDLNAFGNRFYQPAAARTFMVGISLELE
ncbi:TonB-dependent receptor family protein [Cesiribacter andamanensis]|uniref:Vitamin B12/cobalamin outer membrane transporter n=1 Tax=Cesiribacter andamanensis AMV16 TaxID=1279009 RepID=M7N4J7_9BACT|nr:TonB-dependent receptor [Cesiribacter andamanensis]EMR02217.1 vitamin B12/cobalamin outer membrane transporter [Cesiribacter andamanensis AMV16]